MKCGLWSRFDSILLLTEEIFRRRGTLTQLLLMTDSEREDATPHGNAPKSRQRSLLVWT